MLPKVVGVIGLFCLDSQVENAKIYIVLCKDKFSLIMEFNWDFKLGRSYL